MTRVYTLQQAVTYHGTDAWVVGVLTGNPISYDVRLADEKRTIHRSVPEAPITADHLQPRDAAPLGDPSKYVGELKCEGIQPAGADFRPLERPKLPEKPSWVTPGARARGLSQIKAA